MFITNKISDAMQNILCLGVTWLEKNLILDYINNTKNKIYNSHFTCRKCWLEEKLLISKTIIGLPT